MLAPLCSSGPTAITAADFDGLENTVTPAAAQTVTPIKSADEPELAYLLDQYQSQVIRERVESRQGNWSSAAQSLGLHRSNLHRLAKRLGIK